MTSRDQETTVSEADSRDRSGVAPDGSRGRSQVTHEEFTAEVDQSLALVESMLMQLAVADSPFATEAAQHVIASGGKRIRPLLVVLASQCGSAPPDQERVALAACVIELTHVASLYHDDVMDEALVRRGAPSANARWGNSLAILVGDFLFAQASSTVALLGVDFVSLQARTFARLVLGQIAETNGPAPGADPLQHYLRVVSDKTGSLIAAAALFGGMVAEADPVVVDALGLFGEEIGVVFQLSDDIIDITGQDSGKTPGTDLREGVSTLPTLMLAASTDPADADLQTLVAGDLSDEATLAHTLQLLQSHPVIDQARAEVYRRAEVARGYLQVLPDGPARDALDQVCTDIVARIA